MKVLYAITTECFVTCIVDQPCAWYRTANMFFFSELTSALNSLVTLLLPSLDSKMQGLVDKVHPDLALRDQKQGALPHACACLVLAKYMFARIAAPSSAPTFPPLAVPCQATNLYRVAGLTHCLSPCPSMGAEEEFLQSRGLRRPAAPVSRVSGAVPKVRTLCVRGVPGLPRTHACLSVLCAHSRCSPRSRTAK